jgi:hypothetical protein
MSHGSHCGTLYHYNVNLLYEIALTHRDIRKKRFFSPLIISSCCRLQSESGASWHNLSVGGWGVGVAEAACPALPNSFLRKHHELIFHLFYIMCVYGLAAYSSSPH